ncbi:MAG: MarR family transcriptional regulator [Nitriliruptorales bacterium]|nr:MarR family transcriptional regulator [Nitriliruptorales bacterium]
MATRRFDAATEGMLAGPGTPPLPALLRPLLDWYQTRHLELMTERGFDDVRRAHNAVFIHVPAQGIRLTDLADAADQSKQAMGELVDDLVAKGYFEKIPDPTDGRAKLIVWAERGEEAHRATMEVFGHLEGELSELTEDFEGLKETLLAVVRALS